MRVLVVEDEKRMAESLRAGLEAEGYAVDLAHSGLDGLWLAGEHDYAAIVLDVLLPGLNGYRVCGRLRQAGNSTPILVLTAKDGEHDEAEALDTGADDFLSKPFSYVVFLARLRALIRRGGSSRGSVLRAAGLALDLGRRECRVGDALVPLSGKEFGVLRLLVQRAGQVVTKAELLEGVWDFAADPDPNLVEVHVSALRRKLGRDAIRTVRGAGYVVPGA